jgi:hypothetical protein
MKALVVGHLSVRGSSKGTSLFMGALVGNLEGFLCQGFLREKYTRVPFFWTRRLLRLKPGGHLDSWKRNRALLSWSQIIGHTGPVYKAYVHRDRKVSNPMSL